MAAGETVKIEYPIKINGQEVSEFFMRRPTVADHRIAQKKADPLDQEITLFANLLDIAPADVERMDAKDYKRIGEVYQGFLA